MSWTVTLKDLREARACFEGYNKLVRHLQNKEFTNDDAERRSYSAWMHDDLIHITTVLEGNGLDDALWALRCVRGHDREIRLFAVWCARQVQHLMDDPRSIAALDVAERFANGEATDEELVDARYAAAAAVAAVASASSSYVYAAGAAYSSCDYAASTASASASAAYSSCAYAAHSAARAAQEAKLIEMLEAV